MNLELIRKQMEEIKTPELDIKQSVFHRIRISKKNRKRRMRMSIAAALLVVIISTVQYQQIVAYTENIYRNIQLSLNNEKLVIDKGLEMLPIEVSGLTWVGKKRTGRVGTKSYTDINAAEDELKINLLHNTMNYNSIHQRPVTFIYFENKNIVNLLFDGFIIGDLKNFSEEIAGNGDRQFSYSADHDTIYKSPVSMRVMFFTGRGENYETENWDIYDYEEKYISPVNGITAYFLRDTFQVASGEEKLLMYASRSTTDKLTVFVYDNLFYTISGNIPSYEMREIIDSFVIGK